MNRKVTMLLIIVLASMFIFSAILEAQNMGNNEALSTKQQSIVSIAAFTANGNMKRLKTSLNEGLDAGLTVNEIKEILVQLYAYTGFPRSLNSLSAFMGVMEERGKKAVLSGRQHLDLKERAPKRPHGAIILLAKRPSIERS